MYLARTLTVLGAVYFAAHIVSGAITCANEFCPGDSESDYIYSYEDDSGRVVVVVEGTKMSEDDYKKGKYESRDVPTKSAHAATRTKNRRPANEFLPNKAEIASILNIATAPQFRPDNTNTNKHTAYIFFLIYSKFAEPIPTLWNSYCNGTSQIFVPTGISSFCIL